MDERRGRNEKVVARGTTWETGRKLGKESEGERNLVRASQVNETALALTSAIRGAPVMLEPTRLRRARNERRFGVGKVEKDREPSLFRTKFLLFLHEMVMTTERRSALIPLLLVAPAFSSRILDLLRAIVEHFHRDTFGRIEPSVDPKAFAAFST